LPVAEPTSPELAPKRPPLWLAPATVLVGFAIGLFVQVIVELIGTAAGSPSGHPTAAVLIVSDVLFDLSFVAAALYMVVVPGWMNRKSFGYVRINWKTALAWLLAAAAAYYLITWAYQLAFNLHQTDKLPTDLHVKTSTWAAIGTGLFTCVVAPCCEEFFFRGFLFGVLRGIRARAFGRDLGPWIAAVIVAILFGAAHYQSADPQALIPLGFLGFVLCIMRWKTGSLYPGMALHCINNCIALGVTEFAWGVGPIVLCVAGSLAAIWLLTGWLSGPLLPRRAAVNTG
jgi:uncharacterized protein